jgi:hypothetical protein
MWIDSPSNGATRTAPSEISSESTLCGEYSFEGDLCRAHNYYTMCGDAKSGQAYI